MVPVQLLEDRHHARAGDFDELQCGRRHLLGLNA
jgi:hypothetical protein